MVWVLFTVLQMGMWVPLAMETRPFEDRADCESFGLSLQEAVPDRIQGYVCVVTSSDDMKRLKDASESQMSTLD